MIPQAARSVMLAFYSKGRKEFVPLLTHEVARRAKVHEDVAKQAIGDVMQYGWVDSYTRDHITTWYLTDAGKRMAQRIMEAAEVVRSA